MRAAAAAAADGAKPKESGAAGKWRGKRGAEQGRRASEGGGGGELARAKGAASTRAGPAVGQSGQWCARSRPRCNGRTQHLNTRTGWRPWPPKFALRRCYGSRIAALAGRVIKLQGRYRPVNGGACENRRRVCADELQRHYSRAGAVFEELSSVTQRATACLRCSGVCSGVCSTGAISRGSLGRRQRWRQPRTARAASRMKSSITHAMQWTPPNTGATKHHQSTTLLPAPINRDRPKKPPKKADMPRYYFFRVA